MFGAQTWLTYFRSTARRQRQTPTSSWTAQLDRPPWTLSAATARAAALDCGQGRNIHQGKPDNKRVPCGNDTVALRQHHGAVHGGRLLHAQRAGCHSGWRMDRLKASLSRKSAETVEDKVRFAALAHFPPAPERCPGLHPTKRFSQSCPDRVGFGVTRRCPTVLARSSGRYKVDRHPLGPGRSCAASAVFVPG